jgi:hypothetical protein
MAVQSNKNNAYGILPKKEQGQDEFGWTGATYEVDYELPEIIVDGTSTNLQLNSTTEITEGDQVVLYNGTDGIVEGSLGAVSTSSSVDILNIFGDGSCVATYQLNGNANDLSGNYNGTEQGTVTYTTGQYGQCGVFSANGNRVLSNYPQTSLGDTWTISAWVKPNFSGDGLYAGAIGNANGATGFQFLTWNGSIWCMSLEGTYSINLTLTDNVWQHFVLSVDYGTDEAKIYRDGVLLDTMTLNGSFTPCSSNSNIYIGQSFDGATDRWWGGAIDQVRIFSKAISSDEVLLLYNEEFAQYQANISSYSLTTAPTKAFFNRAVDVAVSAEATDKLILAPTSELVIDASSDAGGANLVTFDEVFTGQEVILDGESAELGNVSRVDAGNNQFETVLYTGNGTSQTIDLTNITSGVDFVWAKGRNIAQGHKIFDSIRGVGNQIYTNDTLAETTDADTVTAFNSGSFDLGSAGNPNTNSQDYVAWCASLPNHTPVNTDGTITSETKSNDFVSVVSYIGTGANATVGHSLGKVPDLTIVKNREISSGWLVAPIFLGARDTILRLDDTTAFYGSGNSNRYNATTSTFGVSSGTWDNALGQNMIAYCFTSVPGVCKVGQYVGSGAAGNQVDLGFEPGWVMIKRTDGVGDWNIIDSARSGNQLQANLSGVEYAPDPIRVVLTNTGFIIDTTSTSLNASGGTYIYLAIAKDVSKYTALTPNHTNTTKPKTAYKVEGRSARYESPNGEFETVLYEGNGTTQTVPMANITGGVDFVWIKERSGTQQHWVSDSIRGVNKIVSTSLTNAEITDPSYGVTLFSSSSFNISSQDGTNLNASNFVAWCASLPNHNPSNTDGTITSETKANSFMSVGKFIGTYSVDTVGHGLATAPNILIIKPTSTTGNWVVQTENIGWTSNYLFLNTTQASTSGSYLSSNPTSSTFELDASNGANKLGEEFSFIAFTSVAGKCKVGSYTGTGAAGNAVDCGFEPGWIMIKRTDSVSNWTIIDSERELFEANIQPHTSIAEFLNTRLTVYNNGFSLSDADGDTNASGGTYIYLAIAKNAVQSTTTTATFFEDQAGLIEIGDEILVEVSE